MGLNGQIFLAKFILWLQQQTIISSNPCRGFDRSILKKYLIQTLWLITWNNAHFSWWRNVIFLTKIQQAWVHNQLSITSYVHERHYSRVWSIFFWISLPEAEIQVIPNIRQKQLSTPMQNWKTKISNPGKWGIFMLTNLVFIYAFDIIRTDFRFYMTFFSACF